MVTFDCEHISMFFYWTSTSNRRFLFYFCVCLCVIVAWNCVIKIIIRDYLRAICWFWYFDRLLYDGWYRLALMRKHETKQCFFFFFFVHQRSRSCEYIMRCKWNNNSNLIPTSVYTFLRLTFSSSIPSNLAF